MKNKILKIISIYFVFILIFILLLTLSSCISSKMIEKNVEKSSKVLLEEGNRKIVYIPYREANMQFDNYTDALMINTAFSIDASSPFYSALVARKNFIPDVTTEIYKDSAGELHSSSKYEYHNEVGELDDLVKGEKAESFEYARYWHGYLIILRPLLFIFSLTEIRLLLTYLLVILSAILLYYIYKKINVIVAIIFFGGLFCGEYFYLGFSLQGIFVFIIAVISSIILLARYNQERKYEIFFFIIGILTNFFDFLTVPLVTLCIPLLLLILLNQKQKSSYTVKQSVIDIFIFSMIWLLGYGFTWFGKWILVDICLKRNLVYTAIQQVFYRSGATNANWLQAIIFNMRYMLKGIVITSMITTIMVNIQFILNRKKDDCLNNHFQKAFEQMIPYMIIGIMPFIWYIALTNHSYYHSFFTYRNLIITIVCLNICIYMGLSQLFKKLESEIKNEKK